MDDMNKLFKSLRKPVVFFSFGILLLSFSPMRYSQASNVFTVYRIQQYYHGSHIGSRISSLDCEAQVPKENFSARKCAIISLSQTSIELIREAIFHNVAGILIVLPSEKWSEDMERHFMLLEQELLSDEFSIPIYVIIDNDRLRNINAVLLRDVQTDHPGSMSMILDTIWSTGFRLVLPSTQPVVLNNFQITNIEGYLSSNVEKKLPTIVICAHYDSLSAIPGLSYGADANGSGVLVMLELARIFSRLLALPSHQPKYDLLFLLNGGGKFNYLGSKRWLDEAVEDANGLALLDSIAQVICLEGIGSAHFDSDIYVHLSRPPKNGSFSEKFVDSMNRAIKMHTPISESAKQNSSVEWVHKKINLNEELLAWEHERFSIRRLPSLTVSSWPSFQDAKQWRQTSLDGGPLHRMSAHGGVSVNRSSSYGFTDSVVLARNTRIITEALVGIVFDLENGEIDSQRTPVIGTQWISETGVAALMDLLVSHPRSAQLLGLTPEPLVDHTVKTLSTSRTTSKYQPRVKWPGLIGSLQHLMENLVNRVRVVHHPLSNSNAKSKMEQLKQSDAAQDKSDSSEFEKQNGAPHSYQSTFIATSSAAMSDTEIMLYNNVEPTTLNIYRLKSAGFDLVIAVAISSYLGLIYAFLETPFGLRRLSKMLNSSVSKYQ